MTIDGAGDLWVSDYGNDTLTEYPAATLLPGASPTPKITITAADTSLHGPENIAFDASGDLWVTNGGTNDILEYAPTRLSAGGSTTPAVTISGSTTQLDDPIGLAISTPPTVSSITAGPATPGSTATTFAGTSAASPAGQFTYATPPPAGYYEVASDGGIFAFTAPFHGSMGGKALNKPIVGMATSRGLPPSPARGVSQAGASCQACACRERHPSH